jgi:hypothetical protein
LSSLKNLMWRIGLLRWSNMSKARCKNRMPRSSIWIPFNVWSSLIKSRMRRSKKFSTRPSIGYWISTWWQIRPSNSPSRSRNCSKVPYYQFWFSACLAQESTMSTRAKLNGWVVLILHSTACSRRSNWLINRSWRMLKMTKSINTKRCCSRRTQTR